MPSAHRTVLPDRPGTYDSHGQDHGRYHRTRGPLTDGRQAHSGSNRQTRPSILNVTINKPLRAVFFQRKIDQPVRFADSQTAETRQSKLYTHRVA